MANTRGVFRLSYIREEKIPLYGWVSLSDVWIAPSPLSAPNTGYFGGGFVGPLSSMEKVTYSSDTTAQVPGAALSFTKGSLAATGSSSAGYFGGGIGPGTPGYQSTMDKVIYSTDIRLAVPGAALSVGRYGMGATGNSTAGYFGGGFPGPVSTMDKVTYLTDTTAAVPGAPLSAARAYLAASSARANALPESSILV